MGTFSIFHWLFIFVLFALPVVPILLASKSKRLARGSFILRTIGVVVFFYVFQLVGGIVGFGFVNMDALAGTVAGVIILAIVAIVTALLVNVFFTLWVVHRLQDCGWNKWLALALLLPVVNILFIIIIMFPASKDEIKPNLAAVFE